MGNYQRCQAYLDIPTVNSRAVDEWGCLYSFKVVFMFIVITKFIYFHDGILRRAVLAEYNEMCGQPVMS